MSSILKALKRLEQEKAVRRPHEMRVDEEIIRNVPLRRRTPLLLVALAALALFAGGGGVVYLLVKPSGEPVPAKTEAVVSMINPPVVLPPRTVDPAPKVLSNEKGDAGRQKPAVHTIQSGGQEQGTTHPTTIQKVMVTLPESPVPVGIKQVEPKIELHLDGIAFQDGGGESIAVVNGKTVTRGAMIEGARVDDIQRDRVKFSRNGEKFEIILDRSN